MIRWKLAPILEKRGWSAYRLALEVGLTQPVAYRITRPGIFVTRIDAATLDALCKKFDLQPGQLLEYVPGRGRPTTKRDLIGVPRNATDGRRKTAGAKKSAGARKGAGARKSGARKAGARRKTRAGSR